MQQIDRRRAGWAKTVRQASEAIVDAEFQESSAPQVEAEKAQEPPRAAQ